LALSSQFFSQKALKPTVPDLEETAEAPRANDPLPYLTDFLFIFVGNPNLIGVDATPRGWPARLDKNKPQAQAGLILARGRRARRAKLRLRLGLQRNARAS